MTLASDGLPELPVTLHRPAPPASSPGRWSGEAVQALLDMPFDALMFQAQAVHREHWPVRDVKELGLQSCATPGMLDQQQAGPV